MPLPTGEAAELAGDASDMVFVRLVESLALTYAGRLAVVAHSLKKRLGGSA